jgi:hypothetical protein
MPGLRRLSRRAAGVPGRRPRRWASLGAFATVAILVACDAGSPPPVSLPAGSPASAPTSATPASVASSGSGAAGSGEAGLPAGSPRVDLDPVEPARLVSSTLVCERWGAEPPPTLITCGDAARLALAALGTSAAVTRLDVGYGGWCPGPDAPCGDRSADVTWVVARDGTSNSIRVRIARAASGDLAVWPPVPGPAVPSATFDAPPPRAPDLGGDAPPDLVDRDPFPLCGVEDLGTSDAYATAARRCFLDAVLAGSAAELDSAATSTEGEAVLTVYRFRGSGAVRRWVRSAGNWTASACGIARIDTPAVFEMAGVCVAVPP